MEDKEESCPAVCCFCRSSRAREAPVSCHCGAGYCSKECQSLDGQHFFVCYKKPKLSAKDLQALVNANADLSKVVDIVELARLYWEAQLELVPGPRFEVLHIFGRRYRSQAAPKADTADTADAAAPKQDTAPSIREAKEDDTWRFMYWKVKDRQLPLLDWQRFIAPKSLYQKATADSHLRHLFFQKSRLAALNDVTTFDLVSILLTLQKLGYTVTYCNVPVENLYYLTLDMTRLKLLSFDNPLIFTEKIKSREAQPLINLQDVQAHTCVNFTLAGTGGHASFILDPCMCLFDMGAFRERDGCVVSPVTVFQEAEIRKNKAVPEDVTRVYQHVKDYNEISTKLRNTVLRRALAADFVQ